MNLAKNISKLGLSLATPYLTNLPGIENLLTDKQVRPSIDLSKILSEDLINSVSLESLNFLHEFEGLYEEIIKQYIGEDGKLIVFIDDLDRCLPDKAIDILEAIKLFLSIRGSMFIIGIDHDVVMEGIKIKYPIKEYSKNGWANNYLEKIIQLPFRLPPLRKDTIAEDFVDSITFGKSNSRELAGIFSEVGGNPRTVKRVVNNFELQKTLSQKRVLNVDERIIAKFIVLEFRWPDFYKDFLNLYNTNSINLISLLQNNSENSNLSIVNKYNENVALLNFLNKEPNIINEIPQLDNYIHLARTNLQAKEEFKETLKLGITNIELKEAEKAIDVLSNAILLNEKNIDPYFYRAIAYLMNNDIESYALDINKCKSTLEKEIEKVQYLCDYLIEFKQYDKAKIYNEILRDNKSTHKYALINITKISNFGYIDTEIIEACCFLLKNDGYKKEYYESLRTRVSLRNIDRNVIDAFVVILEAEQLDYKMIQYSVDYYKDKEMLEQAGNVYILEGIAKLKASSNNSGFSSLIDAIKVSKYNSSVISEIINTVISNEKSFLFFKYLIESYKNNERIYDVIERLIYLVSKSTPDKAWNKDYILGEIIMYIEDKEQQKDLEAYLTTTPNNVYNS